MPNVSYDVKMDFYLKNKRIFTVIVREAKYQIWANFHALARNFLLRTGVGRRPQNVSS